MTTTSSLSLWRDRFVFTSTTFEAEVSCRPATVLVLGTESDVEVNFLGTTLSGRALLVGQNCERSLKAKKTPIYSLNLDPCNPASFMLEQILSKSKIVDCSERITDEVINLANKPLDGFVRCEEVLKQSNRILEIMFPWAMLPKPLDSRVRLVANLLWDRPPVKVDLNFLANECGLSPSRLTHLFKDTTGTTIKEYLLWVKMRTAADMFTKNCTLTEVAHEIGFADSAHLSRTFMRFFALKPSFLANDKLVSIQICESNLP